MTLWNSVRFVAAVCTFLVALLVIFPAPNLVLFQVKVGATEYGHFLAVFIMALMLAAPRLDGLDTFTRVLSVIAALVLISTSVRAAMLATSVQRELPDAFPPKVPSTGAERSAFSFTRLWSLGKPKAVDSQTIAFAEYSGGALEFDFYPSEAHTPAPCVIVLHSGGWNDGKRNEFLALNHHLARRGYAVAAIDYRLAPQWKWPAQRDDTRAAIRFLADRAGEFGIDPKKFVLLGRSAGGQIAVATASSGLEPGIRGCIAFYAPADLGFAFKHADPKDILNSEKLLREYMGGTPEEVPLNYASATANGQVKSTTPPMLLLHGEPDELVWVKQSERLAARLKEVGVSNYFVRLPWATHAFDYNFNGPGGQISTWAVDAFLERVTRD